MEDAGKTKGQLIKELAELGQRILELEAAEARSKKTEEMLATERERLAVTLRSIGDGVIATDADGRVILVNEVAEGFTGWAEEEAVGKSLSEIFHIINEDTREQCENPVEKILQTDGIIGLANHTILVSRDGIERLIADSGSPIRDRDGSIIGVVLVFRDVTERRRIEQGIMRAQKLESIAVLAGGIAHDFNNLLTGVLGNISLARMYTDPDKVSERLLEAEKASLRGEELTRQLLTFSRGGTSLKETASIAEILKDSAILKLRGTNIRSEFSIPDNLWQVEVDPEQISQVIDSIVINARQAMPQGGTIRIQAENVIVEAGDAIPLKGGKYVRIFIQDQGIGIPKEHLGRIFDPYFTTKQKGSGLGLAASYFIIRNHGGYIATESQVGVGTTFYIYLPASQGEVPIEVPVESKEAEDKLVAGEGRILVMDDDEFIRELASDMLTGIGYEVTVARDGAEAIRRYKNARESGSPFDLVIIDLIVRDGMEGEETIRNLTEIDPEVKAIASSGYSNDPVLANFREYGFSGAITKPYKVGELSKILRKIKEQQHITRPDE